MAFICSMPASSISASPQATRHCLMHVGRLELTCFDTNLLMQKFTKNQQYLPKSNNRSAHIDSRMNASFGIHWIQCLYTLEPHELCTWSLDVFSDYCYDCSNEAQPCSNPTNCWPSTLGSSPGMASNPGS